jgi:tetratricopeptide (TPR) repeat protein
MPLLPGPTTTEELVYAATIALNNAAQDESLRHLQQAISQDAEAEQAHYMLAIVYAQTECPDLAISHLERAVELEPENRTVARQEQDFESLREDKRVQKLLKPPVRRRRRGHRPAR